MISSSDAHVTLLCCPCHAPVLPLSRFCAVTVMPLCPSPRAAGKSTSFKVGTALLEAMQKFAEVIT